MQKFLIPLCTIMLWVSTHTAVANCDVRSVSTLTHTRAVGPISMLISQSTIDSCTVQFEISVDGIAYEISAQADGQEGRDALCNQAIDRGRSNLLAGLGGKFHTEAVTVCSDGGASPHKLRIGDLIMENEVGRVKGEGYFEYKKSTCRLFVERRGANRKLMVYEGVICKTDEIGGGWIVVDRW